MAITAAMVKELRERTGSGMMECKKILTEAGGDVDAAVELMRKSGLAKADKKAGRTAAEGVISISISDDGKQGAIVEVNCETDFVSKGDDFKAYAKTISDTALASQPATIEALLETNVIGGENTVNHSRQEKVAAIGENIQVRRAEAKTSNGFFISYLHGARIGVMVELEGGDEALGRDIAMHIAASKPVCVSEAEVPQEELDKEKAIFVAQAQASGKPDNIIEKMVTGRIKKFIGEITLLGQPFVKDPDQTIEKLLASANAKVLSFVRFEVGEGIEKKKENFAEEVMAQIKGA